MTPLRHVHRLAFLTYCNGAQYSACRWYTIALNIKQWPRVVFSTSCATNRNICLQTGGLNTTGCWRPRTPPQCRQHSTRRDACWLTQSQMQHEHLSPKKSRSCLLHSQMDRCAYDNDGHFPIHFGYYTQQNYTADYNLTTQHSVNSQYTSVFTNTAVRISNIACQTY
jgi:hypothetical protein